MKVVINKCYGGFGLSHEAMMLYGKLKGIKLYACVDKRDKNGHLDLGHLEPYRPGIHVFCVHYLTEPLPKSGNPNDKSYFSSRDISRDDPLLVKVVEQLGGKAGDKYAELKVVEIPDDVEYEIDEYDGLEHIAEKHRTWG